MRPLIEERWPMLFEPERAAVCVTDLRGLGPNNGNQYDASVLEWPPGYWPERASFRLLDGRALPFVAIDAAYDQDGDVLHVTYASGALRVVVVND